MRSRGYLNRPAQNRRNGAQIWFRTFATYSRWPVRSGDEGQSTPQTKLTAILQCRSNRLNWKLLHLEFVVGMILIFAQQHLRRTRHADIDATQVGGLAGRHVLRPGPGDRRSGAAWVGDTYRRTGFRSSGGMSHVVVVETSSHGLRRRYGLPAVSGASAAIITGATGTDREHECNTLAFAGELADGSPGTHAQRTPSPTDRQYV